MRHTISLQATSKRTNRFIGRALGAIVAAALCSGLTFATESATRSPAPSEPDRSDTSASSDRPGQARLERAPERGAFAALSRHGKLDRRVAFELSSLDAMREVTELQGPVNDHVLYEMMVERVERGVEKATRRALTGELLENTSLGTFLARFDRRSRGDALGAAAGSSRLADRTDFGLRVHSGLPQVEMRYRMKQSVLGLNFGADGGIRFDIGDRRTDRARVTVGYDGDDTFQVGARIGF
jgi:hypothetical protein